MVMTFRSQSIIKYDIRKGSEFDPRRDLEINLLLFWRGGGERAGTVCRILIFLWFYCAVLYCILPYFPHFPHFLVLSVLYSKFIAFIVLSLYVCTLHFSMIR
jgi:hypothetical protein